ncbi:FkbM family methyltransferase [Nocardioides sp. HDW12B]|uniref:FkbM family methyltransferase n=1 Tax=Nocardioides sp. HDW12B TaxID=2714939 RepID=UPI00140D3EB2|nr:FkbM family methyltransferase [Nocardioides sp. HDW12B]QIK66323.1 FkbM family methyltransferase [Nocardioides sp. HDW12B]
MRTIQVAGAAGRRRLPPSLARLRAVRDRRRGGGTPLGDDLLLRSGAGPPDVTPLGSGGWLLRGPAPRGRRLVVEQVDEDTWLVRRRGAGRVLRPLGPDSLRTGLLVDPQEVRRHPLVHELQLLRHLGEQHVGIVLRRLGINVVLDVGANRGQYGRALRAAGYAGRIVSFEPVPASAEVLEERTADDPDWQVHRCALGAEETTLDIHVGKGQGRLSSLLPASDFGREWNPRIDTTTTLAVPVRRLDGLLDEVLAGVEDPRIYLKLDTQGFDLQAFAGAGDRIDEVLAMQSEVSLVPLYESMPHVTEQLATYERAGFGLTGIFPVVRDGRTMRIIEFDAMMVRAPAAGD